MRRLRAVRACRLCSLARSADRQGHLRRCYSAPRSSSFFFSLTLLLFPTPIGQAMGAAKEFDRRVESREEGERGSLAAQKMQVPQARPQIPTGSLRAPTSPPGLFSTRLPFRGTRVCVCWAARRRGGCQVCGRHAVRPPIDALSCGRQTMRKLVKHPTHA